MALPTKSVRGGFKRSSVSDKTTRYKRSEPLNSNRNKSVTRGKTNENKRNINNNVGSTEESNGENSSTQQTKKPSSGKHIGIFVAAILSFIALGFDVVELILDLVGTTVVGVGVVIGYLKDFATLVFFPTVFWALGTPFWKGRKARKKTIYTVTAFLIGLVPWLGAFMPETLISVMTTIYFTNQEAKEEPEIKINPNITRFKR